MLKFPWVVTVFTKEPANHPTNPTTHHSLQHQGIYEFPLSSIIILITDVTSRIRTVTLLLFYWIPQNNNTDSAFCRHPPLFVSVFTHTCLHFCVNFFSTSQNLKNINKKFLFSIVSIYLQKNRLLKWCPWKSAATDTFLLCWCLQPVLQTWQNTPITYSMQSIWWKPSNVRQKHWICPSMTFNPPLNVLRFSLTCSSTVSHPVQHEQSTHIWDSAVVPPGP